ncbi:MAG: P-loop NTPase [Pseudomonadota bacterium]
MSSSKIQNIIAVGSGKGGVGKSTISVNLAISLQLLGYKVGLLDADIMGPSVPSMLGINIERLDDIPEALTLAEKHGIKVMSMGMLTNQDQPVVLRGAMVTKYLKSFISDIAWGELDYLIIDLPPGTGDIQISLCQAIPLTGAVIVTTPQDVSFKIALKGLKMFDLVHVPILGIVENMSMFSCSNCGHETHLFGSGGGLALSEKTGAEFLGQVPVDSEIVASGDSGLPIAISNPSSAAAKSYLEIAKKITNYTSQKTITIKSMGQVDENTLSILWSDDRIDAFDTTKLRLACTCAKCTGIKEESLASNITIISINQVGNYAIRITWSDGHNTGIYSFKHLREMGEIEELGDSNASMMP